MGYRIKRKILRINTKKQDGGGKTKDRCQFTDKQQQKAKMPAAGATQALRLFRHPLVRQESLVSLI